MTLWDALPVFLATAAALAVFARAVLPDQSFHRVWRLRETAGIEGLVYSAVFMPVLMLPLAVAATVVSLAAGFNSPKASSLPAAPGRALRERAGEIVMPLLLACAVAAVIKVGAPSLPTSGLAPVLIAAFAGMLTGYRSGVAIVPAVAIAIHLGGVLPAAFCFGGAVARRGIEILLERSQLRNATTC